MAEITPKDVFSSNIVPVMDSLSLTPAQKRALTIKAKYGDDFYIKTGRKGGGTKTTKTSNRGFAVTGTAAEAGAKSWDIRKVQYGKDYLTKARLAKRKETK